ncbi:hypothetical protein BR93DRAFT_406929 [Coniochaeta sp. PMI_546]|nr:hypothetical protein BR93DRAFT_406929 [Coniochaeta sp. PMI_546]
MLPNSEMCPLAHADIPVVYTSGLCSLHVSSKATSPPSGRKGCGHFRGNDGGTVHFEVDVGEPEQKHTSNKHAPFPTMGCNSCNKHRLSVPTRNDPSRWPGKHHACTPYRLSPENASSPSRS